MKHKILRLLRITALFALAGLITACGGGSGGGGGGGSSGGGSSSGSSSGGSCDSGNIYDPTPGCETETGPSEANAPSSTGSTSIGDVFINSAGLTLYVFEDDRNDTDGDGNGDSDCNGGCADIWPPVIARSSSTASGAFTIITRDDGSTRQWAFNGLPLYLYAGDAAAGDVNGEGLGGTWFVARPDPYSQSSSSVGTIFTGVGNITDVDTNGDPVTTRVNRDGFTLYVFDSDTAGDSNCNVGCAVVWPPLFADASATAMGDFSIITRDDGMTMQWAFKGEPLYFYIGDTTAGDVTGEAVPGWHVARSAPLQLFDAGGMLGSIFAGRGSFNDVDGAGNRLGTQMNKTGFTVYRFDNDTTGVSNCNGGCASIWPPLYANASDQAFGDYSIITRADMTTQWAFRGWPLYFYAGDAVAGDTNGVGIGGVWHEVIP